MLECANIYVKFGAHGPIREPHCPPDIWLDNGVLFISFCRYLHGAKATILFLFSLLFYFFSNTCLPTYLPPYLPTYLLLLLLLLLLLSGAAIYIHI
jgi:hypothetical protein